MQPADVEIVRYLIQEKLDENEIIDLLPQPYDRKGEGGGGGEIFEHPFKVSLEVNEESDDQLIVSKGRLHFWKKDGWDITELEITSADSSASGVVADSSGGYAPEYIYAQLKYENDSWGWSLGHDTTNPQDRDTNADNQEQRTWIIAKLETDGSIDQRINQDIYETMGG